LETSLFIDIQSTGQKSHCVNSGLRPSQCYVLIRQSDSPCPHQFQVPRTRRGLEPILVPKLRIHFADFPYLHCSIARGCAPWGPAAVMGTTRRTGRVSGFSRGVGGAPDGSAALRGARCLAGQADSAGARPLTQKRKLCPEPPRPSPATARRRCPRAARRNVSRLPFRRARARVQQLSGGLGSAHPGPSAVRPEPFPTSALKVPV